MEKILSVKDLHVSFDTYAGEVQAVRGVTFDVNRGMSLAIVGESGSGKSVTVQTVMKLIPMPPGRIKSGSIIFNGEEIVTKNERQMQQIRGGKIGMIVARQVRDIDVHGKGAQGADKLVEQAVQIEWMNHGSRTMMVQKRRVGIERLQQSENCFFGSRKGREPAIDLLASL